MLQDPMIVYNIVISALFLVTLSMGWYYERKYKKEQRKNTDIKFLVMSHLYNCYEEPKLYEPLNALCLEIESAINGRVPDEMIDLMEIARREDYNAMMLEIKFKKYNGGFSASAIYYISDRDKSQRLKVRYRGSHVLNNTYAFVCRVDDNKVKSVAELKRKLHSIKQKSRKPLFTYYDSPDAHNIDSIQNSTEIRVPVEPK